MGFILNICMCQLFVFFYTLFIYLFFLFSSFLGKCLRSLYAESLRLLFVVPGEVSRVLKSSEYLQAGQGGTFTTMYG